MTQRDRTNRAAPRNGLGAIAASLALAAAAHAENLPGPEASTALVRQACAGCHELTVITEGVRRSEAEWRDNVITMIGLGAQIFPDEIDPLAAYLGAYYGPEGAPEAGSDAPSREVTKTEAADERPYKKPEETHGHDHDRPKRLD